MRPQPSGNPHPVAGRHRLQVAIELGLAEVPIREETGGERDARMLEIAENLHRADLTVHEAEWIRRPR